MIKEEKKIRLLELFPFVWEEGCKEVKCYKWEYHIVILSLLTV